jgi:uncharacterized membrane protein HdeD (DUF308 family)
VSFYRRWIWAFGVVSIVLGIALLVQTTRAGGGTIGYTLGILFVALGAGRIFLVSRRR